MLESEFMRLAFAAGAVIGLVAPAVGFFLVQRRMSLIGDGMGHVAFAGVAAAISSVSRRWRRRWLRRWWRGRPRMAAVEPWSGRRPGFGVHLLHGHCRGRRPGLSRWRINVNLFAYLFGSILTVTPHDVVVVAVLGCAALATILVSYRALAAVVLDEEAAIVSGVPVSALNLTIVVLAALTVALSMRIVGILLIAALMVLPSWPPIGLRAACARRSVLRWHWGSCRSLAA